MLLNAALNLSLRLVVVNWIEMRLAGRLSPAKILSYVIDPGVGANFYFIGTIGMNAANDLLPGRNHESVISARADTHHIFAAYYFGAEQRAAIGIGPVNVNDGMCGGWRNFFEWAALLRTSDRRNVVGLRNHDDREAAGL